MDRAVDAILQQEKTIKENNNENEDVTSDIKTVEDKTEADAIAQNDKEVEEDHKNKEVEDEIKTESKNVVK